jgi:ATP-binding cassette subfamily B protein/ATP-binding cassette subfamily C protein LapB
MPDSAHTPRATSPTGTLDSESVLAVVTAHCGADRAAAARLRKSFQLLLGSDDWRSAVTRLDRPGHGVRYGAGPLRDILDLPGELVLLRHDGQGFSLLSRQEQRWLYLGRDGLPVPGEDVAAEGGTFEGVVMRMPEAGRQPGGLSSLAALWPELRTAWAEVGVASLFINAGQLLLPLFALLIYDKVAQNGLFETLWALVAGMVLYLATDCGMRLVRSWVTERIGMDLTLRSDETLWSRLVAQVDLPPGGFPRFLSNYRDLTLARDFVSSSYLLSIADMPFLLLYLLVIGIISWQMMIVCMVLVLVYGLAGFWMQQRQNLLSREAESRNTQKLSFMGEALGSLDIVRTAPGGRSFLRSWRDLAEQTAAVDTQRRLAIHRMGMVSLLMQTVTTVVILTVGVYLIYGQVLSVGKLIACNLLANRAMALVASLYAVTGKWQDFKRAAGRMEESLEPVDGQGVTPRPTVEGRIAVIGLGKQYEGRPAALEQVSLTIAPGERIALLGRPGAGKSTLLRCLGGLCRPDSGQILIDGLSLDHIARFDRVQWLAYKAQEPAIFAGTLEENLRVSGCTESQRFAAAILVSGLESEFKSGRMSLGMALEERGSNLSGGQRQKVALARAFAQPSRILLLDEPTLGLDPESERQLAESLPTLLDPATVLVMTTHSPIMLQTVQRIVALDGGRVVADGAREKLVTLS